MVYILTMGRRGQLREPLYLDRLDGSGLFTERKTSHDHHVIPRVLVFPAGTLDGSSSVVRTVRLISRLLTAIMIHLTTPDWSFCPSWNPTRKVPVWQALVWPGS